MPEEKALQIGDAAPSFCLKNHEEHNVCLEDFKGKWIVLYFYPRDNTPGCTLEAKEFTAHLGEFKDVGAEVIGISPDSCQSHKRFIEKHNLKVTLLSDPEHEVLQKYGVWQLKKMYGKTYYGVVRSTFLIDPDGKIAYIWRKVRVKGHVDAVKKKLQELKEKN